MDAESIMYNSGTQEIMKGASTVPLLASLFRGTATPSGTSQLKGTAVTR